MKLLLLLKTNPGTAPPILYSREASAIRIYFARPDDYYDRFPARIDAVSSEQVQAVLARYADPATMRIVVVAPAA